MHSKLSFLPLLLATTGVAYLLPNPPGRYNVTLTTGSVTDYNRDARELMLSVFQPATCVSTRPVVYMPNQTAEHEGPWAQRTFNTSFDFSPLFLEARLPVCPGRPRSCSPLNAPVLLLLAGYRASRNYFNVLASAIASEGFTVITMDHPGETNVIVYPDGHTAYSDLPNANFDYLTPYAYTRAVDVSFVIDQLSNATAMTQFLPENGPRQFPTDRIAIAGHSLGGAGAILAASQDRRIHSVINWDGPFLGSLSSSGLSQPLLYVATERPEDGTMSALWQKLSGPKLWTKIPGLTHEGMMDLPSLIQAAGQDTKAFEDLLGTVMPAEIVRTMMTYATEWINGSFTGDLGGSLLQGHDPDRFPEVLTLRKDNF